MGSKDRPKGCTDTAECHSTLLPSLTDPELAQTLLYKYLNSTIELPHTVNNFDGKIELIMRPEALQILNRASQGELSPLQGMQEFFVKMHCCLEDLKAHYNNELGQKDNLYIHSLVEKGTFQQRWDFSISKLRTAYIHHILSIEPEEMTSLHERCYENHNWDEELYNTLQTKLFEEKYAETRLAITENQSMLSSELQKLIVTYLENEEPLEEAEERIFKQLTGLTRSDFTALAAEYPIQSSREITKEDYLFATLIYKRFCVDDAPTITRFFLCGTQKLTARGNKFVEKNEQAFAELLLNEAIDEALRNKLSQKVQEKTAGNWTSLTQIIQYCEKVVSQPIGIPENFLCPITCQLMYEPMMAADGETYEQEAIEGWFKQQHTSPMNNEALADIKGVNDHSMALQRLAEEAIEQGRLNQLQPLFSLGLSLQATDDKGNTLLQLAAQYNQQDIALWLIQQGCSEKATNQMNQRPRDIAKSPELAVALIEAYQRQKFSKLLLPLQTEIKQLQNKISYLENEMLAKQGLFASQASHQVPDEVETKPMFLGLSPSAR